jgi:hypothetical protein
VRGPHSMRALADVSLTNSMNVSFAYTADKEASMRRSREALDRLEAIDPTAQLTLVARARLRLSSADWSGQFAVGEELIRHFPNDPTSYHPAARRCCGWAASTRRSGPATAPSASARRSRARRPGTAWPARTSSCAATMPPRRSARIVATANDELPFYTLLLAAAQAHDECTPGVRGRARAGPALMPAAATAASPRWYSPRPRRPPPSVSRGPIAASPTARR